MQQKIITVVIDENGDSSVDLEGFGGQGCEKTLQDFRGADGQKTHRRKADFYRQANALEDQRLKRNS
jgi:hypothetical protein